MMTLFTSESELTQYISVSNNFDSRKLEPYIRIVKRKYLLPIIDHVTLDRLIDPVTVVEEEIQKELKLAVANLAFHQGFEQLLYAVNNYGIHEEALEKATTLSWDAKRNLQSSYVQIGYEALDAMIAALLKNKEAFPEFEEHFKEHTKDLIVRTAQKFNTYYDIGNSYIIFEKLKPSQRMVLDTYFSWIGTPTLERIQTASEEVYLKAKTLADKAAVLYTVREGITGGVFQLQASGLFYRYEQMPWEKTQKIDPGRLSAQKEKLANNGAAYLKDLKKYIENNLTAFPEYTPKKEKEAMAPLKLKSGLFF